MESIYIGRPQAYPFRRPHFVYRVYSHDGTLLYVGSTCDVWSRIEMHSREAHWFDWAYRVDIESSTTRGKHSQPRSPQSSPRARSATRNGPFGIVETARGASLTPTFSLDDGVIHR